MRLQRTRTMTLAARLGTAVLLPEVALVDEPGPQDGDSKLVRQDTQTPGRTYTWLGDRDVALDWKLPSPGL